eukprot:4833044-Lingulodinium_polyedra.AAC.1
MRSTRPRAVAAARKSHVRAFRARDSFCCTRVARERAGCGGGQSAGVVRVLCGSGAVRVLFECRLGVARALLGN